MTKAFKKIVFISGTRADFGKMKGLIQALSKQGNFDVSIFATGMHMSKKYGETVEEITKSGFKNMFPYHNNAESGNYDQIIASTILGFSNYVRARNPDMIVVHGDRIEAMAGAIVGSLNNVLVAHIEGGEVSGTVDEHIRHSVSKLAHIHFVANKEARKRLIQMGENTKSIFVVGSPDLDIMANGKLPHISEVKKRYAIPFDQYALVLYHPVTTEIEKMEDYSSILVESLINSKKNYVVIYPNNDLGSNIILDIYEREILNNSNFRLLPSVRFEHFLTLIKNANGIIGNSSAGVREAPFYGVPSINIGSRQENRLNGKNFPSIRHIDHSKSEIENHICGIFKSMKRYKPLEYFGDGNSIKRFIDTINSNNFWNIKIQKRFVDFE
jgi:UDP-N-acetylglucosamine 2-epimerase (hydrolysing)